MRSYQFWARDFGSKKSEPETLIAENFETIVEIKLKNWLKMPMEDSALIICLLSSISCPHEL